MSKLWLLKWIQFQGSKWGLRLLDCLPYAQIAWFNIVWTNIMECGTHVWLTASRSM
jgi:hypothetical protein